MKRSVVSYLLLAVFAGFVGASFSQAPAIYNKVTHHFAAVPVDPDGFWSTPAIEGYGKIHYEKDTGAFRPTPGLSNKIVIQITRSDGEMTNANLGLERTARMVNLYVASGIPKEQLKFVVSVTGDATPAMLNNQQFNRLYGVDNPNLKLIDELKKAGVIISVCDQSVAFHHYQFDWIDKSVVHALSSPTTVSTLENQGYAFLPL